MRATIPALAAATLAASSASAVTVVAYDTVQGPSVPAAITAPRVTGIDLERGPGLAPQPRGDDFNSLDWTLGGSQSEAIANGDFLTFGFTATSFYDLTQMELEIDRSRRGPQVAQMQYSFDGGAFEDLGSTLTIERSSRLFTYTFDDTFDFTQNVTFRLVGWGAERPFGSLDIETGEVGEGDAFGISITGEVAPIPLPAGLPLLVGALGAFAVLRRRR